jgi:hypothetical protein
MMAFWLPLKAENPKCSCSAASRLIPGLADFLGLVVFFALAFFAVAITYDFF